MDPKHAGEILRKFPSFAGIFPPDRLSPVTKYPAGYLLTTKPYGSSGNHAVAAYFESRHYCEFFDPGGFPPIEEEIKEWLKENAAIIRYSSSPVQSSGGHRYTDACGPMCIVFLALKDEGYSLEQVISFFSRKDQACNDKIAWALTRIIRKKQYKPTAE